MIVVGLDIETTALEPSEGEIIEFVAVRYDLDTGQEVDRFEGLYQPSRSISTEITRLTGITNDLVADKPAFKTALSSIEEFLQQDIVFAHNASFDIGWLKFHGLNLTNPVWDTFFLASITWPETESYNLGTLVDTFNIQIDKSSDLDEHRALYDVELTWGLLKAIIKELNYSQEALQQIESVLKKSQLDHYFELFSPLSSDREKLPTGGKTTAEAEGQALQPRPTQTAMSEAIAKIIEEEKVIFIEAPTGTGKTFAYATPLIEHIKKTGNQGIISTHTRNLQDQLIQTDLPRLQAILKTELKIASLKGRSNYLCNLRLNKLLKRDKFSENDAAILIKLIAWLDRGADGDLERLNFSHRTSYINRLIHADSASCRLTCRVSTGCPYARAKTAADTSDILVTNHALLANLSQNSDEALLSEAVIVIDEAHHFAESLRQVTRLDLSVELFREQLAPIVQLTKHLTDSQIEQIKQLSQELAESYAKLHLDLGHLAQTESPLLLTSAARNRTDFQSLSKTSQTLLARLNLLLGLIQPSLEHAKDDDRKTLNEAINNLKAFSIELGTFMSGSPERIQYIEFWEGFGQENISLNDLALNITPISEQLVTLSKALILTSATLTIQSEYTFIKQQIGIKDAEELTLGGTFQSPDRLHIYLTQDTPHPRNADQFLQATAHVVRQAAGELDGRCLVLVTSQAAVKDLYSAIQKDMDSLGIKLYAQKINGGRANLARRFRENPQSVLIGTSSFWEGLDVPGDSLKCVIIPKLPFPIPTDPILTSIAKDKNINAFTDLAVPLTILKLKQGIGRLIRGEQDSGTVIILDPRLHTEKYGQTILKSLPEGTVSVGSYRAPKLCIN